MGERINESREAGKIGTFELETFPFFSCCLPILPFFLTAHLASPALPKRSKSLVSSQL